MTFKNTHLSYSRIAKYEQCPLAFKFRYVDGHESGGNESAVLGKTIHGTLEALLREAIEQEHKGLLSEERALTLFKEQWAKGGLSGMEAYQDGVEMLRSLVRREGEINHFDIPAVEQEFHLPAGPFVVLGYIDRVDRIDDETIRIIDYKTNRVLFSREEVDASLQMSIYHAAARRLWPWAKNIRLAFNMLRHGLDMETTRTPEQIEAALAYVEAMGKATETATEFPPRLNSNCRYCDHKDLCPAYAEALKGKVQAVAKDTNDLESVAREREEVAKVLKVLDARKDELEAILKTCLEDKDELLLAGMRYRMFNAARYSYPVDETVKTISRVSGLTPDSLLPRLVSIDNKRLDAVLKDLGKVMSAPQVKMLKAELEMKAKATHSARFWAQEVKA